MVKVNNYILIDLIFEVSLLEEEDVELEQDEAADTVALKLKISFYRNEKQIFAEVETVESNFNCYYTTLALRFLEEKINKKRENISQQKVEMHWLISNDGVF